MEEYIGKVCKMIHKYKPCEMNHTDLNELFMWADVYKDLADGYKNHLIALSMIKGENNNEMMSDEFISRTERMVKHADPDTKRMIKEKLMAMFD